MKRRRHVEYYLAASASLVTFIVYLSSLRHEFVEWDDPQYVIENPHIRALDMSFLKWAFGHFYASNWHPLTWVSHAVDYAISGLNPVGHHLTSVVLHAANTWAVIFLVVALMNAAQRGKRADGSWPDERAPLIVAGVTGLLFGLHPLHVESVAWVAERKDLLCALFYILSLMAYTRFAHSENGKTSRKRASLCFWDKRYLFSLGLFMLALLSKPMAVSLPAILVLLDWYPFGKIRSLESFLKSVVGKLPFFVLSLGSSVLTILAQRQGGAIVPMESVPLSTRLLVAVKSLAVYLWKLVWPLNLSPFYPYPISVSLLSWSYLLAVAVVIGISALCAIAVRKQRVWMALWGYYMITLVPVIGIVQVGRQAMADRYTYLPSLGPFLVIGLVSAWFFRKVVSESQQHPLVRPAGAVLALFIIFSMAFITIRQLGIWQNSIRLWSYVIEQHPERIQLAYYYRGLAFENTGQPDRAIEDYNTAIALDPNFRDAYMSRGTALEKTGRLNSALEDLDRAIALGPRYEAYYNRGVILEKTGRINEAITDYLVAIDLDPSRYDSYLAAARAYGKARLFDKAIEYFTRCIAMRPNSADLYNNRGLSFLFIGQDDRALEDFNMAIALDRTLAIAYRNRGSVYLRRGDKTSAIADYQKACEFGDEKACGALKTTQ